MITRCVLIIASPGKGNSYCPGVLEDVKSYTRFFKSKYGGLYSDSEIQVMNNPSKRLLQLKILSMKYFDFTFIIFCGHGYYDDISLNQNILCINDYNEEISSNDLRKYSNKRILIEDCCRQKKSEFIFESTELEKSIRMFSSGGGFISPEIYKKNYNDAIERCPKQIIVATSCDIGETAGDFSKGGYYSYFLVKSAEEIINKNNETGKLILHFPYVHNCAIKKVSNRSGETQNPQIEKPRVYIESSYLPFIII